MKNYLNIVLGCVIVHVRENLGYVFSYREDTPLAIKGLLLSIFTKEELLIYLAKDCYQIIELGLYQFMAHITKQPDGSFFVITRC